MKKQWVLVLIVGALMAGLLAWQFVNDKPAETIEAYGEEIGDL